MQSIPVFRLAFAGLLLVVAVLVVLALIPPVERPLPDARIDLEHTQVVLYPQSDPEAIWRFGAERVQYRPDARETTLVAIEDGARTVAGEVDFTLRSDESVTIDRDDNLRGSRMFVHLVEAEWDLDMSARDGLPVVIDQRNGKFIVPILEYTGAGLGRNRVENVRMNFDLTEFESDCVGAACYNEIEDSGSR